ncbi:MAG: NADH-quinone oxidoreductase subunit A [Mycolicibacterium sp.]|uniref:NADH-quinone oxidoreductase subunit A n=1 Tax=Mycolicibacterium sp. TaxID=2320850 RepID=UPI003D0C0D5B
MYAGAVSMLLTALTVIPGLYLLHRLTAVDAAPVATLPFESGWLPEQHALSRFHVRWYPVTVLFLAFDVEMLFMYPWSVVVADLGVAAIVEMFAFLAVLLVAVLWAWREGSLRWV